MDAHKEYHFEDFIVDYLGNHGWLVGEADHYDRPRALYSEDVIGYLQSSQPEAWAKLEKLNGAATGKIVLVRLVKTLETQGTLEETVGWISEAHPPFQRRTGGCASLIHPTLR